MAERLNLMRIGVIGIKSQIGGNPYPIAPFQHISHIESAQLHHLGGNILALQFPVALCQAIQATIHTNPYRTILLNVLDAHVGRVPHIMIAADMIDSPLFVEGIAIDRIGIDLPNSALSIVIDSYGRTVQYCIQVTTGVVQRRTAHGPHINHICPFVIGYP